MDVFKVSNHVYTAPRNSGENHTGERQSSYKHKREIKVKELRAARRCISPGPRPQHSLLQFWGW